MQGYCGVYKWTILKWTSPEVKCLHLTSSKREICTSSISNVIYHKFSHGAAFYTLNGENNVMLEFSMKTISQVWRVKNMFFLWKNKKNYPYYIPSLIWSTGLQYNIYVNNIHAQLCPNFYPIKFIGNYMY